jgi:hypothetical protein
MLSTCGLDTAEFAFFVADVAGRATGAHSTRRGIIALRKFEPGETLLSVPFDSLFSADSLQRSRISHLLPVLRHLGMDDMAVLVVALM